MSGKILGVTFPPIIISSFFYIVNRLMKSTNDIPCVFLMQSHFEVAEASYNTSKVQTLSRIHIYLPRTFYKTRIERELIIAFVSLLTNISFPSGFYTFYITVITNMKPTNQSFSNHTKNTIIPYPKNT